MTTLRIHEIVSEWQIWAQSGRKPDVGLGSKADMIAASQIDDRVATRSARQLALGLSREQR